MPKTILVVEDEQSMLNVLTDRLQQEGYTVLQAKEGQEALKIASNKHPDLILLDIIMPKMDGMTMMKEVRQDAWGKTVPIILLTNLNADDKILKGVAEDQPSYYLVKTDLSLEEVVEKIKEKMS